MAPKDVLSGKSEMINENDAIVFQVNIYLYSDLARKNAWEQIEK